MLKNRKQFITQVIASLFTSFIFGLFGLLFGSDIGGNYGFPTFGHVSGWEAGGVFFGILGLVLGAYLGISLSTRFTRAHGQYLLTALFSIPIVVIELLFYDYFMSSFRMVILLLLPTISLIAAMNLIPIRKKIK